MRFLASILFCLTLVGCASESTQLNERTKFWKSELAHNIPTGTPKEKALQWGKEHQVKFAFLEKQNWLYANVERVPDSGIGFPCSEWNIILKVFLGADGKSVGNEVNAVGSCL
ncbi:hypothetical protein [Methylosarcina fibrata]|uniref:hypothetical protein n=1 Tax=Methylosarcina fibrata TaxID=105972 RepID=UPI000476D5EA|nr:hypothetical protein [Methylosarcina fibrata]